MAVPSNAVQVQGQAAVTADQLNTYVQNVTTAPALRQFIGVSGMVIILDGIAAQNDGSGGAFYWDTGNVAPDDNLDVIVPTGANNGAWVRMPFQAAFTTAIVASLSGGGAVPSTGVFYDLYVPFGCTIGGWALQADQTGSLVIDVWKKPFAANTPPTITNTITAGLPPTLASQEAVFSNTLTGWTTAISAGDWLRFNLTSISTITRCTLTLVASG